MTSNEYGRYPHETGLETSRPLPSSEIKESLVPLEVKDPAFFEIVSGIVSDEVRAHKYLSWRLGRMARKYTGSTRSVNAMYKMIDRVETKIPLASAELARHVVRQEVFGDKK